MTAQEKQTRNKNRNDKNKKKKNQFRLLTLNQEWLNISVSLQTAFAVETHLATGQCLEMQVTCCSYECSE
jgi:hypothetical protein